MILDRSLSNAEAVGYFFVTISSGDQAQDFGFALG